jgi:hypothetical protein
MNRASCFVSGVAFGIAGLYMSMHFSVVRATDGFHVVPKIAAKVEMPYFDIRKFTLGNWQRKPALALAILRANKGYLLGDPSLIQFKESSQKILDQFSMQSNSSFGG